MVLQKNKFVKLVRKMVHLLVLVLLTIGCGTCYGQRYDAPRIELLDLDNIQDVFCIGDVVFITRESDAKPVMLNRPSLDSLGTVKTMVDKAKPSKQTMDFVDSLLGSHQEFEFASAKVLNLGDTGFQWNIVWTLYPDLGGLSGTPFEFRATILADGSVAPHEMSLCDHYETVLFDPSKTIISWLPFEKLTQGQLPTAQRAVQIAQETLDASLKRARIDIRFRSTTCEHQSVPHVKPNSPEDGTAHSFWAVHFVPQTVSSENEKGHAALKVWVCANGATSNVEVGQWSLEKRRAKE